MRQSNGSCFLSAARKDLGSKNVLNSNQTYFKIWNKSLKNGFLCLHDGPCLKILLNIAAYMSEDRKAWPTQETIAKATGYERETVNKHLNRHLIKKEWLKSEKVYYKENRFPHNVYMITEKVPFFLTTRNVLADHTIKSPEPRDKGVLSSESSYVNSDMSTAEHTKTNSSSRLSIKTIENGLNKNELYKRLLAYKVDAKNARYLVEHRPRECADVLWAAAKVQGFRENLENPGVDKGGYIVYAIKNGLGAKYRIDSQRTIRDVQNLEQRTVAHLIKNTLAEQEKASPEKAKRALAEMKKKLFNIP